MRNLDKKKLILIGIVLYLATAGISYAIFSLVQKSQKDSLVSTPLPDASGKVAFDEGLPKT